MRLTRRQFGLGIGASLLARRGWAAPAAPSQLQVRPPMSFTYVNSNENGGGGSAATVAVTVTGVHAGDIIVASAGGDSSTAMTLSDGTSSLTGLTAHGSSAYRIRMFYLLSSVASGSVTYTVSYTPNAAAREVHVWVYTPSASATFDVERADQSSLSGTAVSTGSITTTGTDELVVASAFTAAAETGTSLVINSGAADHSLNPGGHMQSWSKLFASTFTSDGQETLSPGTEWMASIASFKIAGGGGGRTTKNTRAFPLGMAIGMNWVGPGDVS